MRHCKTACFEALVLEPHFAQSCARFFLLYCILGWVRCKHPSKMQIVKFPICPTHAGCICSKNGASCPVKQGKKDTAKKHGAHGDDMKHIPMAPKAKDIGLTHRAEPVTFSGSQQLVDKLLPHPNYQQTAQTLSRNIKSFSKHQVPPYSRQRSFPKCDPNTRPSHRIPGTRLLIEGFQPGLEQKSMLPIFAKAPCCLELFGCCCRRLSQHGVGEVLIPLRHCWWDAFFCVCLGTDRFVTIGRRTAQFCFGLLMRCLFLGSPPSPLDS